MKKLNLAIVSPFPPSKGTLNEYAFHLVKHLNQKPEIENLYILSDEIEEEYPKTINGKEEIIACWKFNSYKNIFKIVKAAKSCKADIVLFNLQFLSFGDKKIPAALGLMIPYVLKLMGVSTVVLLHNITETVDYESAGITKSPIMKKLYSWIGTVLTKILLMSDLVTLTIPKYVEIIQKKYGAQNVTLIPHGSFELPPMPNFDEEPEVPTIMTFGKFGTYKKVENMIEAVLMLRKKLNQPIKLVVAGTDNPNVKGYLNQIRETYNDQPDIVFTGYVEEEDVPGLFKNSTAVVFDYTSTTGSSGVLHQAGSYGKAVVIPQIGDLKELIEDEGYVGAYYETGDVEGMAVAIEQLIVDKEYRKTVAKQNFAAAASLPMEDIVDWYLMHFEYTLRKKNPAFQAAVKVI